MNYIDSLCDFINESPCNFMAVGNVADNLREYGFTELKMAEVWRIKPGGRHYVRVNGSALFAFIVGDDCRAPFNIIASHSDSPGFRIKPNCTMVNAEGVMKINTEVYGGPILYTWFDRPLGISGRVALRSDNPLKPEMSVGAVWSPMLIIPHLAIHFNRAVNEGNPLSKQKDMLPVMGLSGDKDFLTILSEVMGIAKDDIISYELSLFPIEKARIVGVNDEFVCAPRLDDLSMVHASMEAFIDAADTPSKYTRVLAVFDNEETGSGTKQGAASPAFASILRRIMGCDEEAFQRALAESFLISADNAHGYHPNYGEKYDPTNHPVLGGGPCVKINANCKYMTDGDSEAVFRQICAAAGVPCQTFVNHSDVAGGSTLGNILTATLPLRGVDMGAPLWAMHSAVETASTADHIACIKAFRTFYSL